MRENGLIIAIDGPAGSGKSTLAKQLAKRLGYLYIDTGAMYRAVTWKAIAKKIPLTDEKKLQKLARESQLELKVENEKVKVLIDGRDVSEEIRTPLISNNVSTVAQQKGVRECMVAHQRKVGEKGGVVLEGRDIGTVVFPDADVKFFIEADLEERARRRQKEMQEKGIDLAFEKIKEDLRKRDDTDQSRKVSPLKAAIDAHVINSTLLTIDTKTEQALKIIEQTLKKK